MSANSSQELIKRFYDAFARKDFKTMQELYSDDATFTDEVFINLNAKEVRSMWEMLLTRSNDLKVELANSELITDNKGTANWIAQYTFSKTKRKVVNNVTSRLTFDNGKIVAQQDTFNFYKWARQALGTLGLCLGWTTFFKKKVQRTAREGLNKFMSGQ